MFKKTGKLLSLLLSMVLVITLGAGNSRVSANELLSNSLQQSVLDKQFSSKAVQESFAAKHNLDTSQYKENNAVRANLDETVRVVVQLQDKPAIERKGVSVQAVKNGQAKVVSQAKAITGKKVEQTFGYLVNGFSMDAKRGDIPKLKNIDGVSAVTEAVKFLPDLTNAKGLTQVYSEWKDLGYKGEGMVVAILDSGVDSTHKDMRITDPSKDTLTEANVKDKITNLNLTGKDGKFFTNKVPFGYNYADHNLNIVDTNPDTEMHGMHVAGIVAANGTDEEVKNNQAVQGVAPEAQLLAMRVFSNTDKYAYEDTIVAAIDDAALLGVNVINMSLGATAGFQEDNDPEQLAIKNATDAGVVVVVSAGNSYYSTKDFGNLSGYGLYDTGVVGSPSAAKDALSVASYENTNVTLPAFSYTDGTNSGIVGYTTSEVNPLSILKDTNGYQLVDCGVGRPEDFAGKDLKGKIALIQRGTLSFVDKKYNAQTAGAIGAIVYNNSDSGYINMATDPRITIPGIFVSYGDGNKLKGLAASGVKVKFAEGVVTVVPNALTGAMSDFTSWGTNPDLTFKPQITAPGGNIYSTANENKYQTMSGTSMAAPHTAGSEALIMQALKERTAKGEISFATPRDMVNFAKDTAINTAVPQMDKSRNNTVPYSPRRQGAGLVQIENAINNKVLVKDNTGSTTAALKEIGKQTTFDLNLTNYGTKDVVYNVSTVGGLLRQSSTYGGAAVMPYDVSVSGGSISFDKSSVTVPAGKTAKVTVTLSLPDNLATEQFVEGYVRFTSEDTTV
ncbi:MAG: S8 family serine peptidase, partial [Bacillota bacterium]|nr:S8 family serine peptidase [Bacillota bacterium]